MKSVLSLRVILAAARILSGGLKELFVSPGLDPSDCWSICLSWVAFPKAPLPPELPPAVELPDAEAFAEALNILEANLE